MRTCTVDGCELKHYARGLCRIHYRRMSRHGDLLTHWPQSHLEWLLATIPTATAIECIDWPFSVGRGGYGSIFVDHRSGKAHRVACEWLHGPAPDGKEAAHSCARRICVNPHHLRWATRIENQADRIIHGTSNRGSRGGAHKLTEDDVREIRCLVAAGSQHKPLAERFGVDRSTISTAASGTTWGWLQ